MPAAIVRNVLPVVTALVATLYLATAVQAEPSFDVADNAAQAELQQCVTDGRDTDACLDEADGKALVERADWLARNDGAGRRASR